MAAMRPVVLAALLSLIPGALGLRCWTGSVQWNRTTERPSDVQSLLTTTEDATTVNVCLAHRIRTETRVLPNYPSPYTSWPGNPARHAGPVKLHFLYDAPEMNVTQALEEEEEEWSYQSANSPYNVMNHLRNRLVVLAPELMMDNGAPCMGCVSVDRSMGVTAQEEDGPSYSVPKTRVIFSVWLRNGTDAATIAAFKAAILTNETILVDQPFPIVYRGEAFDPAPHPQPFNFQPAWEEVYSAGQAGETCLQVAARLHAEAVKRANYSAATSFTDWEAATCCDSELCNTLNATYQAATTAGALSLLAAARTTCDVVYATSSTATYPQWESAANLMGKLFHQLVSVVDNTLETLGAENVTEVEADDEEVVVKMLLPALSSLLTTPLGGQVATGFLTANASWTLADLVASTNMSNVRSLADMGAQSDILDAIVEAVSSAYSTGALTEGDFPLAVAKLASGLLGGISNVAANNTVLSRLDAGYPAWRELAASLKQMLDGVTTDNNLREFVDLILEDGQAVFTEINERLESGDIDKVIWNKAINDSANAVKAAYTAVCNKTGAPFGCSIIEFIWHQYQERESMYDGHPNPLVAPKTLSLSCYLGDVTNSTEQQPVLVSGLEFVSCTLKNVSIQAEEGGPIVHHLVYEGAFVGCNVPEVPMPPVYGSSGAATAVPPFPKTINSTRKACCTASGCNYNGSSPINLVELSVMGLGLGGDLLGYSLDNYFEWMHLVMQTLGHVVPAVWDVARETPMAQWIGAVAQDHLNMTLAWGAPPQDVLVEVMNTACKASGGASAALEAEVAQAAEAAAKVEVQQVISALSYAGETVETWSDKDSEVLFESVRDALAKATGIRLSPELFKIIKKEMRPKNAANSNNGRRLKQAEVVEMELYIEYEIYVPTTQAEVVEASAEQIADGVEAELAEEGVAVTATAPVVTSVTKTTAEAVAAIKNPQSGQQPTDTQQTTTAPQGGSDGLSDNEKVIVGVCVGVGGALLIGAAVLVAIKAKHAAAIVQPGGGGAGAQAGPRTTEVHETRSSNTPRGHAAVAPEPPSAVAEARMSGLSVSSPRTSATSPRAPGSLVAWQRV